MYTVNREISCACLGTGVFCTLIREPVSGIQPLCLRALGNVLGYGPERRFVLIPSRGGFREALHLWRHYWCEWFSRSDLNLTWWWWHIVNASLLFAPLWNCAPVTQSCYLASWRNVCCFGESTVPWWWLLCVGRSSGWWINVLFKNIKRSLMSLTTLLNMYDSKVFVRNIVERTELSLESFFFPPLFYYLINKYCYTNGLQMV